MAEEEVETLLDASVMNLNIEDSSVINKLNLPELVKELQEEDLVSLFFLLMDYISPEKYFQIICMSKLSSDKKKNYLINNFLQLCKKFNVDMIIELIGTIKSYKLLKKLGTCYHVFKQQKELLCQIDAVWKFLYGLCEEISNDDLVSLKEEIKQRNQDLSVCSRQEVIDSLGSAEELICYAFMKKMFYKNDLSIFVSLFEKVKPECVPMITSYIEKTSSSKTDDLMQSSFPSGIAVIINHTDFYKDDSTDSHTYPALYPREHTENDIKLLNEIWKIFGFQVFVLSELTDVEVIEKFKLYSKMDHSNYDAFVCCYLSHGDLGVVYASNSKPVNIDYLINIMANHCPTLIGKPKLFFIQACQGRHIQQGVNFEDTTEVVTDCPQTENVSKSCDVYKVVSTIPGYVSFRDKSGSWFIRALVKALKDYGDIEDITKIMFRVTDQVSNETGRINHLHNCKQTCVATSTLRRPVIFRRRTLN